MNTDNAQDKPKRSAAPYFTVRTTASGIVDQLANQLRTLHTVGITCGYKYVHDPPSFHRSWHPRAHKLQSGLNKAERSLFLHCRGTIPAYRVIATVQRAISRVEGLSFALFHEDRAVARFLGFDKFDNVITDKRFSTYPVIDVPFDSILTSRAISDIQQLRAAIGELSTSQSVIYAFSAAGPIYPYLARLRALLAASGVDPENFNFLGFPGRYWKARSRWPVRLPAPQDKTNVVIHIRRGDSTVIDLGSRRICLHGGLITDEMFDKILDNDPGRQVDIAEYKDILNRMFGEFGADNFACTLISDGYEQTCSLIIKAIHRRLLRPDSQELQKLKAFVRSSDRELMELARQMNAFPILGESNHNLCKSIHALACADIVIYGPRGFSFGVHKLFHKRQDSIMINVKDNYDHYRHQIDAMVATRANERLKACLSDPD